MSDSLRPHDTVHGILQARRLEWVAFPLSRRSSQPRNLTGVPYWGRQILYQLSHQGVGMRLQLNGKVCNLHGIGWF